MKTSFKNEIKVLFLKHYEEWCLISFRYVKDMAEAEDIVHDVIYKMLTLGDKAIEIANMKGYIVTSIRNLSIKKAGVKNKLSRLEDAEVVVPVELLQEERLIWKEDSKKIQKALDMLPEQSKKVFELCVMGGVKYKNAAEILGISINTVKYHLQKSFKILRINLRNFYLFIL